MMKEGVIKDVRIQFMDKQVEITIASDDQKERYIMPYTSSMNNVKKGMQCKFELVNNKIKKLFVNNINVLEAKPNEKNQFKVDIGQKATHPAYIHSSESRRKKRQGKNEKVGQAKAPYNFVPVNEIVVKAPAYENNVVKAQNNKKQRYDEIPSFDRYHEGLYTGYIHLDIETLTPLYIRDSYKIEEEPKANTQDEEKWENSDFFSPAGNPCLPGSSLRGMIRNLVEIASCSRMDSVEDSTLYYRSLADKCKSIRNEYFEIMGQRGQDKNNPGYKFHAGYLQRNGNDYNIIPAKKQNGKQYQRTPKTNKAKFSWHWQDDGSCITVSGPDPSGKKTKDWLINPADRGAQPINISRRDLNSYCNDVNRYKDKSKLTEAEKRDGDLLRCLRVEEEKENSQSKVPCFYVIWKDKDGNDRVSFGNTAYFRLPYRLSIKEHLPQTHQLNEEKVDLSNAIFGQASTFAGRVFFEDAHINSEDFDKIAKEKVYLKILSNPKPTTFQHYLEQKGNNGDFLIHWNNEGELLRGYKMYWHRKTPRKGVNGWEASSEEVEKSPTQYTAVKPIAKGCHFQGRIRFENLSNLELGALLFVLDLPDSCAHKIGMGKPLGLGSIRIKPSLILSKRVDKDEGRYGRLFNGHKWYLAETSGKKDTFKTCFAEYMLKETKQNSDISTAFNAYWDTRRMKELKAMLDFDRNTMANDWLNQTRYMEIERKVSNSGRGKNEFKNRPVLATPSEVIKEAGIIYE